ncbi:hypothetical protein [uncultured Mobiluncus sp.]|uniref:hypothetical protein n=1 Tax=uncultured Mobiluncus sp. TaxID=293425 RepID=UPI0025F01DD2|nr:hypothetical protein [uncultured Mobiluncus sp.]
MAYTPLPIKEVLLSDICLDLENYRVPTPSADDADALKYLFVSEDVMEIAEKILRNGYFDNEVPVVYPDPQNKGTYVVVEGNRRVSALKALNNPSVVPSHQEKLKKLLNQFQEEAEDLPSEIRVMVSPSKKEVAAYIASLHTGKSKRAWSLDQQANYYYSLLDDTTTVEMLKAKYPGIDVVRFIKMAVMRRFIRNVPFTDSRVKEYASSTDLSMSVFEYAYSKNAIASTIGVSFSKDGLLKPVDQTIEEIARTLPEAKIKSLQFLLTKFMNKELTTRSKEFKADGESECPEFYALLKGETVTTPEPQADAPSLPDDSTLAPQNKADTQGSNVKSTTSSKPPRRQQDADTLNLNDIDFNLLSLNMKSRFDELGRINIKNFPIATSILMRSALETIIKLYLDSKADKSLKQDKTLAGDLLDLQKEFGNTKGIKNEINVLVDQNPKKDGSVGWFNAITHDKNFPVSKEEVFTAWRKVCPVIVFLLKQIEQNKSQAVASPQQP